ncbi:hypothetical protein [Streptomyces gardneri]|uniref:hypothetical protein n=1 Tax=Streptomyces gardneri TaxID=66892 RepID=UPI0036A82DB2
MPSPKLRADQHLLVIVAACSAVDPMGANELAAATGVAAKNCGLVPAFAMTCGLLVKGHRRATHLPSEKGRYVARAFQRGESEGLAALRGKLKGQWFARTVKERCRYGPVSREGLVAKLMVAARAETERIKQAHILLDLMVAVGMVTVEPSGELHWFEGSCHPDTSLTDTQNSGASHEEATPAEGQGPSDPAGDMLGDAGDGDRPGQRDRPEQPDAGVPRPRSESPRSDPADQAAEGTGPEHDLLSLLLPPVLLADLTRLTATEVLELHSHLTAITALTAKLRGRLIT